MQHPSSIRVCVSAGMTSSPALFLVQVKTDEYTMQNFHLVKYCHVNHFGSTLGLAGLAVVWLVASQDPYNLHISATVFKVKENV